ncbi:MAG: SGNH/GDSL hydrolase family protein [Armatimonadota bacterium]
MLRIATVGLLLGGVLLVSHAADAGDPRPDSTVALLEAGESATIVCFGDSITGAYYHTGCRRAWADMLGIALQRLYPDADPRMVNAGISGDTTRDGPGRIEDDVLAHRPDLVVVMFGINDMSHSLTPAEYGSNLSEIIQRCSAIGSEVVLCTPTFRANYTMQLQQTFRNVVREVAAEHGLAVADMHGSFASLHADAPAAYELVMSDSVHPNMHGHKRIAETAAAAISGREVSLADVAALDLQMRQSLTKKARGEALKAIAMPPYDEMLREALDTLPGPAAKLEVVKFPTSDSVEEMEQWAEDNVREAKPDFVLIAVLAAADAPSSSRYIAAHQWVLNFSLDFGPGTWDCVPVLPSVAHPDLTDEQADREALARALISGKDLNGVEREDGDDAAAEEIFKRFVQEQYRQFVAEKYER